MLDNALLLAQQPASSSGTGDLKQQIEQNEVLFGKIRHELTAQLSENLNKINAEISDIRHKQSMMSTMESRKIEEQRQFADSLNRPAEMLEEMKQKWETIMSEQTETMKDLVNQTVTSALHKEHLRMQK